MKRFENKSTTLLSSAEMKTFKGQFVYWLFFAVLIVVALVSVFPAIWTLFTAFKETEEIYGAFTFLPKNMSPSNLWRRLSESWMQLQLGRSFIETLILSLGDWVFAVVINGLAGFVLSKIKPKGSRLVFVLIVWTMMMPGQIRMVPNYMAMLNFPFASQKSAIQGISLLDTFWPMWLSQGVNAFTVILFKNAFDGLSQSYVEAAQIDGCSNIGIFFKIMFPLAMPTIIFVSIGALNGAWADFFGPLLYFDNLETTPLKIYRLKSDSSVHMNNQFMAYIFACIPQLIIYLIFQKRIVGGVNIGGVKG